MVVLRFKKQLVTFFLAPKLVSSSQYWNHVSKCLLSSNSSDSVEIPGSNPKDSILQNYVNRNPRNLEMLRIAKKPAGYDMDADRKCFWYRLEFRQVGRQVQAAVRHHTGAVVLTASSGEWPLQSRLPSISNVVAAATVGQVIARRCLEAGFTEMTTQLFTSAKSSQKTNVFLQAVESGGVRLQEDFQIHETDLFEWADEQPTRPWEVPEEVALKRYKDDSDVVHNNTAEAIVRTLEKTDQQAAPAKKKRDKKTEKVV